MKCSYGCLFSERTATVPSKVPTQVRKCLLDEEFPKNCHFNEVSWSFHIGELVKIWIGAIKGTTGLTYLGTEKMPFVTPY